MRAGSRGSGAALALAAGLAAALGTPASAQPGTPWQVEAGIGAERLSGGAPGWRQQDLRLAYRPAPRQLLELQALRAERYGRSDSEIGLAAASPLGGGFSLAGRVHASPGHRFLPQSGAAVDLAHELGGGWVLGAGAATRRYASDGFSSTSQQWRATLERYVGSMRWAAALTQARLGGGSNALGGQLQADHELANGGRVGLTLASGEEIEAVPGGLVSSRVDTVALTGRWPLAPRWALNWALTHTRQSGYERRGSSAPPPPDARRSGGRLGVQLDF